MHNPKATNVHWHAGHFSRDQRWQALACRGATIWMTGLSGSGKSTIAVALERLLVQQGRFAYRLDGDNMRHGLNSDLGFSADERQENVRRVGEVAKLFADSGVIVIASFISPSAAERERVRRLHQEAKLPFMEVFVDAPLEVCEQRDPKGIYKKARAGEIKEFTGIDAPYDRPEDPDLHLDSGTLDLDGCVDACVELLRARGVVAEASPPA